MSEYEIFNNEGQGIEIIPEPKRQRKERKSVEKKGNSCARGCKEIFKLAYLPMFLSILAIFFSLFVKFLPIAAGTFAAVQAASAFFFMGFASAFAALIIETINMFKGQKIQFNLNILLITLSFFVLYI